MIQAIKNLAKSLLPEIIRIRRHLHMYPELSFQEKETSAWIAQQLSGAGIEFTTGWAGYGIVASIKGKSDKVIALRSDMDGLPIEEKNDVPYKSKNLGAMHACGHDVHTACMIGAALILQQLKESLPYTVRFLFQPGEEKLPGGASMMITEGALKNPVPDCIIGQHVYPSLHAGKAGIRAGLYMASADEIYINVKGRGGHGAMPHDCVDVVLTTSHLIVALQQIVSRKNNATIPSVLSFGKMNTIGGATNILPDEVRIEGTFRTMDESWRVEAHALIQTITDHTCKAFGAEGEVTILKGYPCLVNEPELAQNVHKSMKLYLGSENIVDLPMRMTSEDFAFYSQQIPACFYRLGTGNVEKGITSPVHTPSFDIDESSLETGMGLMAWLAVSHS